MIDVFVLSLQELMPPYGNNIVLCLSVLLQNYELLPLVTRCTIRTTRCVLTIAYIECECLICIHVWIYRE